MSYIFGEDRTQDTIFSLEDYISPENPVRLIDLLVDKLYHEDPSKYTQKGKSYVGRPAYHPRHMLKLYVYGYMNKITSSRTLETESKRNIELKWLINNLCPDFKTIADFRKDNSEAIKEMTLKFRFMLSNQGLITGELMAIDGTKLKANAGAKEFSYEDLTATLTGLDAEIERYLTLLKQNDLNDEVNDVIPENFDTLEIIRTKINELQAKHEQIQNLQIHADNSLRKKVNPTDPESRMISSRKEHFSGYNLQIIVDSLFKLIASANMRQSTNDLQEMAPALEGLKDSLGIVPQIIVADNGYDNVEVIQAIEAVGDTEVLVVVRDEEPGKVGYSKWSFKYDQDQDCYYCPMKQLLKRRGGTQKRKNRLAVVYQCKKSICHSCKQRSSCCKSKEGRTITRYTDEAWVENYRDKMNQPREKALLRRRKAIVEHVFGVLKCWMGKIPLLLRGRDKVQIEIDLYTTAYNLKRLIKLFGFDKVKSMLMAKWAENGALLRSFSLKYFSLCSILTNTTCLAK